jgi:hypothetical protein
VRRLLEERYADATPERRADVVAQLVAALSPAGTAVRRQVVRTTAAVLARALELALAERIANPDRTIVVVLLSAARGRRTRRVMRRGRTEPEALAAADRAAREDADAQHRARMRRANAWLDEHPHVRPTCSGSSRRACRPDGWPPARSRRCAPRSTSRSSSAAWPTVGELEGAAS